MIYQHILVATDLADEARSGFRHVYELAHALNAKLSFIHVIEPIAIAFGADVPMDLSQLQEQQMQNAIARLNEFTAPLEKITETDKHVVFGQPKQAIHQFAIEQNVDLIMVGSHGRHGLALILGSTTNDVLSGAPCDVLAVDIKRFNKI